MQTNYPEKQILPTDSCPKRRSDVYVRVVEGETIILDRQGGLIHRLNRTASYIWDRCDGQYTLADITHHLVEAFAVEAETAAADVVTILRQCYQLNLLEPSKEVAMCKVAPGEKRINHV